MKNFMSGKKKVTIFAVTAATALINAFVADPAQAETITALVAQYLPTIIVFAGGIFGVNREAKIDLEREKTNLEREKTKQTETVINGALKQQVDKLEGDIQPVVEAQYEPFDPDEFAGVDDRKLKNRAAQTYLAVDPMTIFFAAQDKGKVTKCRHIDQALSYWDFLHMKVLKAFDYLFGFPYADAKQHLDDDKSCPYYSVDNMARQKGVQYWTMLKNIRWVIKKQQDLDALADSEINWYDKLESYQKTLYTVGMLASEIVKTSR